MDGTLGKKGIGEKEKIRSKELTGLKGRNDSMEGRKWKD
jgi:hypothetical protein